MVRLHEVYEDARHVYIVMENCKGGDLESLLEVRIPSYGFQTARASLVHGSTLEDVCSRCRAIVAHAIIASAGHGPSRCRAVKLQFCIIKKPQT